MVTIDEKEKSMVLLITMVADQSDVNCYEKHEHQRLNYTYKHFEHVKRDWYNPHG